MPRALLEGYFPKTETAHQLNTTTRTLDRMHQQRVGPPRIKIGKRVFYRADAVREWLLASEKKPVRSASAAQLPRSRMKGGPASTPGKRAARAS